MSPQEYFAALAETGQFTLDELQQIKLLPFALAVKLCGPVPERIVQPPLDSIRLRSPDGGVWVLTITNEGRARTTKEA